MSAKHPVNIERADAIVSAHLAGQELLRARALMVLEALARSLEARAELDDANSVEAHSDVTAQELRGQAQGLRQAAYVARAAKGEL